MRIPASSNVSKALPAIWDRLSISKTRAPSSRARRSANTLPANPAPTIRKSNIAGSGRERCGLSRWHDHRGAGAGHDRQHLRGDTVPIMRGNEARGAGAPLPVRVARAVQHRLSRGNELFSGGSDLDDVAIKRDDVGDRGRDDRLAAGEVLERLGRGYRPRCFVASKGHERYVKASQEARKIVVGLLAEAHDVASHGNGRFVDLCHRTDQRDGPVGTQVGDLRQKVQIEALV